MPRPSPRIPLLATVLLLSACRDGSGGASGGDCVRVCTETGACKRAAKQDCAAVCADYASLDRAAGCTAQFDTLLRCQVRLPDVCKPSPCDAEVKAWRSCLDPYCQKSPATPGC